MPIRIHVVKELERADARRQLRMERLLVHLVRQGADMSATMDALKVSYQKVVDAAEQQGRVLADVYQRLLAVDPTDAAAIAEMQVAAEAEAQKIADITAANTPAA
jgi:hypothetical protein